MRSLVQNLLTPKANPIGIDFGTEFLRLAQMRKEGGHFRLVAAEEKNVPADAQKNGPVRAEFFAQALREIFGAGKFTGRQVILGLPAASTFFGHLRLAKMDAAALTKAIAWEIRGKLPIEPEGAIIRHLVAGEVFVEQEPRDEIIVMASRREVVEGLLNSAEKARLDIVGMNLEIAAIVECFAQLYRRKNDASAINCFLELGSATSRVIISTGRHILFVRSIPVGCHNLNAAPAAELNITPAEAARRQRLAEQTVEEPVLVGAGSSPVGGTLDDRRCDLSECEEQVFGEDRISAAVETVEKIVEELNLCRRYYDAAFPGKAIDRLIFVGGGAADRRLCQEIARNIGLPAQVGDPLIRVEGRDLIDQGARRPQPGWATAIGLTIGGAA